MWPTLIDGKVFVPIIPSGIEIDGETVLVDGMRELTPDEPEYDETLAAIEATGEANLFE